MIVVLEPNTSKEELQHIARWIEDKYSVKIHLSRGEDLTILGLVGNTSNVDAEQLEANEKIKTVINVAEPFKKANRLFHPDSSEISVGDRTIGGEKLAIIAGPCSVESEEQIVDVAKSVQKSGAGFLRGGAFKPRTSPYAFQGLKYEGLELLKEAKKITGLPIVTELMSERDLDVFVEDVDVIQIGTRNMQNFELLKELGKIDKPILLKRGMSATVEEFLMSAEYIMAGGNEKVILCERGIRTFESYTRNTLDLSIIPAIKKLSHLPIVIDPSHATGKWWMVESLSKAAIAAGADGLIIEVHNNPEEALCDGQQSLKPTGFDDLMIELKKIAKIVERDI